jgi:multidrug efflux pump subunit AcrA (membrane-fusion protein)
MSAILRRSASAAAVAMLLAAGCGGHDGAERPGGKPAADAAASSSTRVVLTPEAIRQAGIATEVTHRSPFAATLSLPAKLSPTPETPEELEARLAYQDSNARFQKAAAEFQRLKKLASENVAAAKTVQEAQMEYAQAEVERRRAQGALQNLGIGAPSPAFPHADIWALAQVYEAQVPDVKPEAEAWIAVESAPGEQFSGRVLSLARFLRPETRTFTARVAVKDPRHRLRPQETATVEVKTSERQSFSVPASALLYEGTDQILFVKTPQGFEKRRVRVGPRQGGRVEVLEGISEGDEVVTQGAQALLGELFKTTIPGEGDESDEGD